MKYWQMSAVLAVSLGLAGCNAVVQKAADNTPVDVLPLASKSMTGTMTTSNASPLSLHAQATFTFPVSTGNFSFSDFDPSSLPSALQNPSGLDIPISFSDVKLSCTPGASPLQMTVNSLKLTVSDTAHGSQAVTVSPNLVITLAKTSTGYSASSNTTKLHANWSDFKAIVVKNGANTPNTASLSGVVTFNDGVIGCAVTLNLLSTLRQNIRY